MALPSSLNLGEEKKEEKLIEKSDEELKLMEGCNKIEMKEVGLLKVLCDY